MSDRIKDIANLRIFIAGPTASGKSALAIALAKRLDALILNCDAMQVYCDLRVITARPDDHELSQAEHKLFGEIDGAVNYSVGHYLRAVTPYLDLQRPIIFVGGTGLYFKAMMEGLSPMPTVSETIRQEVRALQNPYQALLIEDPVSAIKLNENDHVRIMRALEIFRETGETLPSWQKRNPPKPLMTPDLKIFLEPNRDELIKKIDQRFIEMMKTGAIEEVENLQKRHLDPMLPIMRAHGVPALMRYLKGEIPLDQVILEGQLETRQYSKRQMTWFRNQMKDWLALPPQNAFNEIEMRVVRDF